MRFANTTHVSGVLRTRYDPVTYPIARPEQLGEQFPSRRLVTVTSPSPRCRSTLPKREGDVNGDQPTTTQFHRKGGKLVALSIMRRFTFCAGHRLVGHEGKCRNLHGHNYVLEVFVTGQEQDSIGRILDFKMLKERVNGWLDENWDHAFILWNEDRNGLDAIRSSQPHRVYELSSNPTAENMAAHFLHEICPTILEGTDASAFKVRLWESEETCAEVTLAD